MALARQEAERAIAEARAKLAALGEQQQQQEAAIANAGTGTSLNADDNASDAASVQVDQQDANDTNGSVLLPDPEAAVVQDSGSEYQSSTGTSTPSEGGGPVWVRVLPSPSPSC